MRRHNSEAGRRAIRSRMQRVCKCHGKLQEKQKKNKTKNTKKKTVSLKWEQENDLINLMAFCFKIKCDSWDYNLTIFFCLQACPVLVVFVFAGENYRLLGRREWHWQHCTRAQLLCVLLKGVAKNQRDWGRQDQI